MRGRFLCKPLFFFEVIWLKYFINILSVRSARYYSHYFFLALNLYYTFTDWSWKRCPLCRYTKWGEEARSPASRFLPTISCLTDVHRLNKRPIMWNGWSVTMYEEVVRGTESFNATARLKWMEADTTSISSHPLFSLWAWLLYMIIMYRNDRKKCHWKILAHN